MCATIQPANAEIQPGDVLSRFGRGPNSARLVGFYIGGCLSKEKASQLHAPAFQLFIPGLFQSFPAACFILLWVG
jgi:hypothetical protein